MATISERLCSDDGCVAPALKRTVCEKHYYRRRRAAAAPCPENLELWTVRQPYGQRVDDKLRWAVEFVREYAPEMIVEE